MYHHQSSFSLYHLYLFIFTSIILGTIAYSSQSIQSTSTKAYVLSTNILQVIYQRIHITFNDFYMVLMYGINLCSWPFRLFAHLWTSRIWVPMILFLLLLLKKPPDPSLDFWHIASTKSPKRCQPILYGCTRYIFSSLNSVNNYDHIILLLMSSWSDQNQYFQSNIKRQPTFPIMPSHFKCGLI